MNDESAELSNGEIESELAKCFLSVVYFVISYVLILDGESKRWIRFVLWPEQKQVLETVDREQKVIILKARQLGITWLLLAYALWTMIFRPIATILIFSKRDPEAVYLLDTRLKGMWTRLPDWMKNGIEVVEDNKHIFELSNGSSARAFPSIGGDSYTATLAIGDECDLMPDFDAWMAGTEPTVETGGKLALASRADKKMPTSGFKNTYRAAKLGKNDFRPIFLSWHVRPGRNADWYNRVATSIQERTGSLDQMHEQYPATDSEALKPNTLDKRIPSDWIERNYLECEPIEDGNAPALPGLIIYEAPIEGEIYTAGLDPAEGNPQSDDSCLNIIHKNTGRQVAKLKGKFEMTAFAGYGHQLGRYYNYAGLLVERNNHGHTVIAWLVDKRAKVLMGSDGKAGWLSSSRGKVELYDNHAESYHQDDILVVSMETYTQVASIEANSLRAPTGLLDDDADSIALADMARRCKPYRPKRGERRKRPVRQRRRGRRKAEVEA